MRQPGGEADCQRSVRRVIQDVNGGLGFAQNRRHEQHAAAEVVELAAFDGRRCHLSRRIDIVVLHVSDRHDLLVVLGELIDGRANARLPGSRSPEEGRKGRDRVIRQAIGDVHTAFRGRFR